MDGVLIRRNLMWSGSHQSPTGFHHFFASISDAFLPLYWITGPAGSCSEFVGILSAEEDVADQLAAASIAFPARARRTVEGLQLFPPGTLPAWSRYIHDDWFDLIGLRPDVDPVRSAERMYALFERSGGAWPARDDELGLLEEIAEFCFYCVDGAYWEMYSRDAGHVLAVVHALRDRPDVILERRTLDDHPDMLEPGHGPLL